MSWFLVGLGCLRLVYRKFVNRGSDSKLPVQLPEYQSGGEVPTTDGSAALHQTKLARAGGSSGEASLLLTPPDRLLWLFFRCCPPDRGIRRRCAPFVGSVRGGWPPQQKRGGMSQSRLRDGGWFNSPALHQIIQGSMGSSALFLNSLALLTHGPPL